MQIYRIKVLEVLNSKVLIKKLINFHTELYLKDNDLKLHNASLLHQLVQL